MNAGAEGIPPSASPLFLCRSRAMSLRLQLLAFIAALVAPTAAMAAIPAPKPEAAVASAFHSTEWRVECGNNGKTLDCQTVNQIVQQNGAQLVSITIHPLAKPQSAFAIIQLPLGIPLETPVQLRVDAGQTLSLPFKTCLAQGCIAAAPLSKDFLAAALKGTGLRLSFGATDTRSLTMTVPLEGFAVAYDHMINN